ncbi:MAG: tetratricopeptide repeat protein, partial [Planctomycetes bacterium]|nr:tetratricopeptide repeat protein [Planctomycetota bacterium]
LKPGNLMLQEDRVFVLDFGLAKSTGDDASLSASGSVVGTPAYKSPEQAHGLAADARSDVYSLGATLYEQLSARPPFPGEHPYQVLRDVVEKDPAPLRGVPRDLVTVTMKCLEKRPGRRYASARELADDLKRFLDGEPIAARPISGASRLLRRAVKHRAVVVPTAVALLLGAAFGGWVAAGAHRRSRDVRSGLETASRLERDGRLREAREALLGVLKLDDRNEEARAALARVDSGLAETSRREEEERKRLEADRLRAETLLRKSERVSRVLSRWSRLKPVLREMEAVRFDTSLSVDERRRRCSPSWRAVEEFLKEAREDPTSRSAAAALAGWASALAGDEEEGLRLMRESRETDPDVPFGPLLEALLLLTRYANEQRPFRYTVRSGSGGLEFDRPSGETEEMARIRRRLEELLHEAAARGVWGREGAEDFLSAVEGIRAAQVGDNERAERELTRAISAPALEIFESGLLFVRSEIRYLQRRFREAVEDLEVVLRFRPRHVETRCRIGLAWQSEAMEKREDGLLDRALSAYLSALEIDPRCVEAWGQCGMVRAARARVLERRNSDPRDEYRAAVADFDRVLLLDSAQAYAWCNRGCAQLNWGVWVARHGGDPTGLYGRALRDFDEAHRRRPEILVVLINRAEAYVSVSAQEAVAGRDPRPWYRKAIADLDSVLAREPRSADIWYRRARVHARWADFEKGEARVGEFDEAIADYGRALEADPRHLPARFGRGGASAQKALSLVDAGRDPGDAPDRAIADLDVLLEQDRSYPVGFEARGLAYWLRGLAETMRKNDPTASFERALADAERELELRPKSLTGRNLRGDVLFSMAERTGARELYLRAVSDCEEVVRQVPTAWRVQANLGRSYEVLGRLKEAVEAYEAALKVVEDSQVREAYERARKRLGSRE